MQQTIGQKEGATAVAANIVELEKLSHFAGDISRFFACINAIDSAF